MNQPTGPDLDAMLKSPQATALLKNKDAVQQVAQSQDAQALLQLLDAKSGHGLQEVAERAERGDPKALFSLMQQVMKSPEGAKLVERINKTIPR